MRMLSRTCGLIVLVLFSMQFSGSASAAETESAPAPEHTEVFMEMRTGVKLAADVYFPTGESPWPVILTRTPYLKDSEGWPSRSKMYTEAGYVYVVQDCRGKGRSEGFYAPFEEGIPDGYDSVEWIAEQDWCDGNVGMSGGSAMGITGNLASIAAPPHLKAAYVVVAPTSSFANNFINGVFKEQDIGSWLRRQGAGDVVDMLKARVTRDVFWDRNDVAINLKYIRIPIFNVGGWYDIYLRGNLANFAYLQNRGTNGARGNQKLFMGPFGHGQLSGDLAYPGLDPQQMSGDMEIRWFDHWLKGIDNGIMDEPPVEYYMMASARKGKPSAKNRFIRAANWPPASRAVRYYLTPDGGLSKRNPTAASASTSYPFDPNDPVPTIGGANLTMELGPMDQRVITGRKDYLRFETPTLTEDVAIAGQVIAELYAATSGTDTDFMVKLVDVYPDGYEALVLDCPIRARYRYGRMPDDVKLMIPGVPAKLSIDLWSTAITFEAGHKIALHITSSNSPRFEVNPNTGEEPGSLKMTARVVENTIHHDKNHPSALALPVVYPEAP